MNKEKEIEREKNDHQYSAHSINNRIHKWWTEMKYRKLDLLFCFLLLISIEKYKKKIYINICIFESEITIVFKTKYKNTNRCKWMPLNVIDMHWLQTNWKETNASLSYWLWTVKDREIKSQAQKSIDIEIGNFTKLCTQVHFQMTN